MTEFAFIEELSDDAHEEKNQRKQEFPFMPEGEAFIWEKTSQENP